MAKEKFRLWFLWLSLICIIIFILELFSEKLLDLFLLDSRAIYSSEYWRFVTAIFIHSSTTHLLYNMFGLLFFGFSLERIIGSKRFLILFLGSGIIGNLVAVNFYSSSAGASGAIYGIIGCLAIIAPFMIVWAFGLIMPMFIAAIIWIIGDVIGLFVPSNVGNIAHLSGAAVGICLGILIRLLDKKSFKKAVRYRYKVPENYMRTWEDRYMK